MAYSRGRETGPSLCPIHSVSRYIAVGGSRWTAPDGLQPRARGPSRTIPSFGRHANPALARGSCVMSLRRTHRWAQGALAANSRNHRTSSQPAVHAFGYPRAWGRPADRTAMRISKRRRYESLSIKAGLERSAVEAGLVRVVTIRDNDMGSQIAKGPRGPRNL